jgi:hypothetical protein
LPVQRKHAANDAEGGSEWGVTVRRFTLCFDLIATEL